MTKGTTTIIAEAGVNHNGELALAMRLIEVAAAAGADLVKFQTFSADRLVTGAAGKALYQLETTPQAESQRSMLKRLELTGEMHDTLFRHCQLCGIAFLSTGFDTESVDQLLALGIDRIKIPSGEITNRTYLRHVGSTGKPVILSTGMATIGEIADALDVLERAGTARELVTVLHCTTEYPTQMDQVNLRAMESLRVALGVRVGYSDHTVGTEVAIAAVALGAEVIEKHFTLDRSLPGPDHRASIEPDELKSMVRAIRSIERALGDGIKRPTPSELKNRLIARKSLVAARAISEGERFSLESLSAKRPGTGLSPMRIDEVVGRRAVRNFAVDELIEL